MVVWHKGQVFENQVLGHKFRLLKLKVLDDPGWSFTAGQFVLVRMGRTNKVNSYSPCNYPTDGIIEILVDVTPADFDPPAGEGSRFVRGLVAGDMLEFAGPAGNFVYKDDGAEVLWFVTTGSGISSLWSVIRERLKKGETRPVRLWWGLRHEEDMIWEEELTELGFSYPNFSYRYVLSKPQAFWNGAYGHVTEHVLGEAEKVLNKEKVAVYLCGNNEMITQVTEGLSKQGFDRGKIYWEKYF